MSKDIKCKYSYLNNALIEANHIFLQKKQVLVNFLGIIIYYTMTIRIVILVLSY